MIFDDSNDIFQTAASFINSTGKHLFLTGKAGTGKTTFLKFIRAHSFKKMAVVAPTGVAAINAGGVTIHSFFQIPPGTFLPANRGYEHYEGQILTPQSMFRNMKMNREKRSLIRELDLLVIDEVSMVRADLLDAMDAVLRHFRKQPLIPFGGVQVLYIGDLFQLPPVTRNDEWKLMQDFYKSPFFFDAQVISQAPPVYIELKKIYRQRDDRFINILNAIRNNAVTSEDLDILHQYYKPEFTPPKDDHYITLTTHNEKAEIMNQSALRKLPGEIHEFKADISADFPERSYPADLVLKLKVGAQVMFIKNDSGEQRKYYNGKIGAIHTITEKMVTVSFPNEPGTLELKKETWKNIRYRYNQEKDLMDEEELGSFSQFPIRLAWAITIHKSQGLTFEKAIIDAGDSFAAGQVYVALSRLTGLEGLVLKSKIFIQRIQSNETVSAFVQKEQPTEKLVETLHEEQQVFARQTIIDAFSWKKILDAFQLHLESYEERYLPDVEIYSIWAEGMVEKVRVLEETGQKFQKQLYTILESKDADHLARLHERAVAAGDWFKKQIDATLLSALTEQIELSERLRKMKKYIAEISELRGIVSRKRQQYDTLLDITRSLGEANNSSVLDALASFHQPIVIADKNETVELPKRKKEKGETQRATLYQFRLGKTMEEIASERNLAISTIEGHLAGFVATGELDLSLLVPEQIRDRIIEAWEKDPAATHGILKRVLGDDISYGQIRAVLGWKQRQAETLAK